MRKETCQEKIARKSSNGWCRVTGFFEKTQKIAKARVKKVQLEGEKKAFGVQFMDMMNNGASDQDLQVFVGKKRTDIQKMQEDIDRLKAEAIDIEEKTKNKIRQKKNPVNRFKVRISFLFVVG